MSAFLPTDPALPQLGVALDEAAMAATFAAALRGRRVRVAACRVERIKYRPRRNCTLSYLLQLEGDTGAFEQRVAARLCSGGDAARRAATAAARGSQPSPAGPALLHVASLDMLTHWWPNDTRLDAPRLLADHDQLVADVLPEIVAALGGGSLGGHRLDVVQYVPEQRLCARVRVQRDCDGAVTDHTLYVKADSEERGAATHAAMRTLEQAAGTRAGRVRTARSLLWQARHGLHWQCALPGRALLDQASIAPAATAAAVGRHLAGLHRIAVPAQRACTRADLVRAPADVAAVLGLVDASWKPALNRLAVALARGAAAFDDDVVTLHGDLHPRNVLVDDDRIAFIDLDNACRGPAALDLGAWIADTLYRTLLDGGHPAAAAASVQAFVSGYAAGGGTLPCGRTLAWAAAYQVFCQRAWRCVVNLKPGRFALTPRLIALAGALLQGMPAAQSAEIA